MKYQENINSVAELQPDYMGFIFYDQSSRFFDTEIPKLPKSIIKTGVFVDADLKTVLQTIKKHDLQAVQLHGKESPEYCTKLKAFWHAECHTERRSLSGVEVSRSADEATDYEIPHPVRNDRKIEIIKVFSIKDNFNFDIVQPYEGIVDYFLFDTKGKLPGGNGYTFNWDVLKDYSSTTPYFLSGGIGLNEINSVLSFLGRQESKYCYAIDVNSKFEIEPGLKKIKELERFKEHISHVERM